MLAFNVRSYAAVNVVLVLVWIGLAVAIAREHRLARAGRRRESRVMLRLALVVVQLLAVAAAASAQEPATRAEELAQQREEKSKQLAPPQPGRLERALLVLENGRLFERLLNPPEGFYPKIGNITAGGGFAIGPAYRKPAVRRSRGVQRLRRRVVQTLLAGRLEADVAGAG